ncbi:hypothetical protein DFH06DRAFT_1215348 [Mycena polygramma]|nr:hypothetical protein DFH06DRAFT_1215348 [Mycena polygramma]
MHLSFFSVFVFLAVPLRVIACEGECITGVTAAWKDNYTEPVHNASWEIAKTIARTFSLSSTEIPSLMGPIINAYESNCSEALETAIFPRYFHGKCLTSAGVEPKGCPNPDCPIVCGTPGSLVHFFPKLRSIAYNQTRYKLTAAAVASYPALKEIITRKMSLQTAPGPRLLRYRRSTTLDADEPSASRIAAKDVGPVLLGILQKIGELLQARCGEDFRSCSWEDEMKEFILSFP